jgi:hypothetical protein
MRKEKLFVRLAALRGICLPVLRARTNRPQVLVSVDSRAMAILPCKLDSVVAHGADILQRCLGHRNEFSLSAVPLTEGAGTVSTEVFLRVLSHVAIVPGNPNNACRFDMVDFSGKPRIHRHPQSSTKPFANAVMKPILVRLTRYVRAPISGRSNSMASVTGINRDFAANRS